MQNKNHAYHQSIPIGLALVVAVLTGFLFMPLYQAYGETPVSLEAVDKAPFESESSMQAQALTPTSGSCGPNAQWVYSNKTLTIRGTGAVTSSPWKVYSVYPSQVVVSDGITSLPGSCFSGIFTIHEATLPASLTSIGESAFAGCYRLESITIPSGVKSIEEGLFSGCSDLREVIFAEGSQIESIGDKAFNRCSSLARIVIPDSVASIGKNSFSECKALGQVGLPSKLSSIGDSAFYKCNALQFIELPQPCAAIGDAAFDSSGLYSIDLTHVESIGQRCFSGCKSLMNVECGVSSGKLRIISERAFEHCSSLQAITLPDSVDSIGKEAFYDCTSLSSAEIKACSTMGADIFKGCNALSTVLLGSGVREVGESFIGGRRDIQIPEMPEGLVRIGKSAFAKCKAQSNGVVTIPSSVTTIEDNAFGYASGITRLSFQGSAPEISQNALYDVTANADYPANDQTWSNRDLRTNYGGTITWYSRNEKGELVKDPYWNRLAKHISIPFDQWNYQMYDAAETTTYSYDFAIRDQRKLYLRFKWDDYGCIHADFLFSIKNSNGEQVGPHGIMKIDGAVGNKGSEVLVSKDGVTNWDEIELLQYELDLPAGDYHVEVNYMNPHRSRYSLLATSISTTGLENDTSSNSDSYKQFPDVVEEVNRVGGPEKVWYIADGWLDYVVQNKLMSGYASNGFFGPYDNITRAQVAVILYRSWQSCNPSVADVWGSTTDSSAYGEWRCFDDEQRNVYYTAAINWAKGHQVMTGDASTNYRTVRPDDPITREELCLILARYASMSDGASEAKQEISESFDSEKTKNLQGLDKVSDWARGGVAWAVNHDVIGGIDNGNGSFSMAPQDNTWRASMAKMITVALRDVMKAE